MPELFVTNFNRNFTGVSATAANVIRQQADRYDLRLVGYPLPGCPNPITLRQARAQSRNTLGRPFAIWHVRRNTEMRAAIWARDVLKLPISVVFTSAAQRRHSMVPRWMISRMDAVVATSAAAAGFVPHVRATVPHGVDTDRITPAADRAAAAAAEGRHGGDAIPGDRRRLTGRSGVRPKTVASGSSGTDGDCERGGDAQRAAARARDHLAARAARRRLRAAR